MTESRPIRVIVTPHATERLRERCPDEVLPDNPPELIGRVRAEVLDALAAGRRRARLPKWADRYGTVDLPRNAGTWRFVWPESEAYCYVVCRQDGDDGERALFSQTWRVVTCVPRLTEQQMADVKNRRKSINQMGADAKRRFRDARPPAPDRFASRRRLRSQREAFDDDRDV